MNEQPYCLCFFVQLDEQKIIFIFVYLLNQRISRRTVCWTVDLFIALYGHASEIGILDFLKISKLPTMIQSNTFMKLYVTSNLGIIERGLIILKQVIKKYFITINQI